VSGAILACEESRAGAVAGMRPSTSVDCTTSLAPRFGLAANQKTPPPKSYFTGWPSSVRETILAALLKRAANPKGLPIVDGERVERLGVPSPA
jgi:hypothetical protein